MTVSWHKAAGSRCGPALTGIKRYVGGAACYRGFPRMSLRGDSVNRGNPPTFLVVKESSSYLSLLLLLWALFLREQDVVDRYVHLRDPKASQVLHPVYHVVAHGLGGLWDRPAVLNGQREIGGSLLRTNLHGDAACLAPTTDAGHGARHAV